MDLVNLMYWFAVLTGLVCLLIGVGATFAPNKMAKVFGIAATGTAAPYVVATGIRDVFLGIAVLFVVYVEQWIGVAILHLCLGLVGISDFTMVFKHGNKKISLTHIIGSVVMIIYGSWVLYKFS
jgi:hypothetical protein